MSKDFQIAVKENVEQSKRATAIDRLVASDERTDLSVLVQTGGLDGEFRRQALEGLIDCGGTDELESLADDPSLPPSLRRRATEAV
jgi:hypothetical protein